MLECLTKCVVDRHQNIQMKIVLLRDIDVNPKKSYFENNIKRRLSL